MTKETGRNSELARAFMDRRSALRTIAKRAGSQEEDDIVQDAFLRIVERSSHEKIQKLDNLLAHVVRCLALDRSRRKARRSTFSGMDLGETTVDPAADPERSTMGVQRLQLVWDAIQSMPPKRREAFLLHRVENMTYAQIARRMNVSAKAIEKHIYLAMRQLSDADD